MSVAIALLLAGQTAATSPPAAEQGSPTVVVTGRRPDRERAVRHMTATIAPLGDADRPLPRFAAPICPDTAGLPAALGARFVARMRDNAARAGLTVDREGCAPNITVLFVPNGQAVVRALHKTRPAMFGTLEPFQIRRLAADTGPVHQWSFTQLMSRDDDRPRVGTTTGRDAPELQVRTASIIQSPTRVVVDGAVMLIDQDASVGKTVTQLADYAAMRLLAQARPVGSAASEATILRLFDRGEAPPPAMTPFDLAYLKALYHGEATERPFAKVSAIARAINRDLAQAVATTTAPAGSAPVAREPGRQDR